MKFLVALLLAFTLTLTLPAWAGDTKESAYERVIRTGTIKVGYAVWPPYTILDPNTGELTGLAVDYVNIAAGLLNLKIEWVQMTGLGTQVEALKQGHYDVVANDSPYVFTMINFVDFSNPVYYFPVHAYVRVNDKRFKKLNDLNSSKVTFVGIDGDLSVDLVARMYPKAVLTTLPASTDPGQMMMNVKTKKADIAILDPGSIDTFNKNNVPGLVAFAPQTPVAVYPIGFSMMKDDGKLLTMINSTIAAMHNTNSVTPLLQKWLPNKGTYFPVAKPYEIK